MVQALPSHFPLSSTPTLVSAAAVSGGAVGGEPETPWPKGAVTKPSSKFPQPQKVPGKSQFRDEIIIRNADSGKSEYTVNSSD